jgi:hypothetical protein
MRRFGAGHWLMTWFAAMLPLKAGAGSFSVGDMDVGYQLQATYALGVRLEKPHPGVIDTPPSPEIPLPDYLKLPESINYDDGDRNFRRGALINNRLSLLGEVSLQQGDYGLLLRGDAFYDDVYRRMNNDNDSPDTINKREPPVNEFTAEARHFDGARGRLLDAYVHGTWYFGEAQSLNLRLGRHIAAWGESLFFAGVALAQSPADATKATVPGADVKSILLPVNQISGQWSLNEKLTLLGQYKLEFKEIELNPVGEFFSVSDVVGPGAQFIYGIDNPLHLGSYSDLNLLSDDVPEAIDLVVRLLAPQLPTQAATNLVGGILAALDPVLPDVPLPVGQVQQPGAPRYINVQRADDIRPSDSGQWGLGLRYQTDFGIGFGLYHLRYHNTTPAPVQNYGNAVLLPGNGVVPDITTGDLGLEVPVTYNIRYFDGVHLSALSFSTQLFGANVGGELIYRDGVDVLVDVDGGLLGPVPTPSRARVSQALLSGIYVLGPQWFWDSMAIVGEAGYVHVNDVDVACGPTSCSTDLTFTRDASGLSLLALMERRNIFDGWDLQVPVTLGGVISGHSSLLSGLGSLMGEGDYRAGTGVSFTWLQKMTLGFTYSAFLGKPHFSERPYADRDYAAVTATYRF